MSANLKEVRARFRRAMGLPFSDVLPEESILAELNAQGIKFRDRVFSPPVTLWTFLQQVLTDDHSCRDAVSRVVAHRTAKGLPQCSARTGAYPPAFGTPKTALTMPLGRRVAVISMLGEYQEPLTMSEHNVAAINSATAMYSNQIYSGQPDFVWLMKNGEIGRRQDLMIELSKSSAI